MNERILIPWKNIPKELQREIDGDIRMLIEKCTTPLRRYDDCQKEYAVAIDTPATDREHIDAIIEIATRPPKLSAVEEMDRYLAEAGNPSEIKERWQAVKAEMNNE